MMTQPQYAGTATIQVAREAPKVLNMQGIEQESNGGGYYFDEFYQTQYELLKSRSLSEAVVRDLKLADNYDFLSNYEPDQVDALKELPREERFGMATNIVNGNTTVQPVRMSSIMNVQFASPNPQTAAAVANAVAENFVQSNLTRRFEAAAISVTRTVRAATARDTPPDLAPAIMAAINADRSAARAPRFDPQALRAGLVALAVVQMLLALPVLLLGRDSGAPVHIAREVGSFDFALAVGFFFVGWRPARAYGMLPLVAALVGCLAVATGVDLVRGAADRKSVA